MRRGQSLSVDCRPGYVSVPAHPDNAVNSRASETSGFPASYFSPMKLEFPSTRGVLWDHRPIDTPTVVHPTEYRNPVIILEEKTIRLAHRFAQDTNEQSYQCQLVGYISGEPDGAGVNITVERFDGNVAGRTHKFNANSDPGEVNIPCMVQKNSANRTTTAEDYVEMMEQLHGRCTSHNHVDPGRFIAIRANCSYHGNKQNFIFHIDFDMVIVTTKFKATPINPVPIVPTALSKNLAGPMNMSEVQDEPKSGYLTMDHTRKLLLILESDPKVGKLPTVGIWMSGVSNVYDSIVWANCLRYLHSTHLQDRVCTPPEAFLLVLYSPLHSKPEFYECVTTNGRVNLDFSISTCREVIQLPKDCLGRAQSPLELEVLPLESGDKKDTFDAACHSMGDLLSKVLKEESGQKVTVGMEDMMPRSTPAPHQAKAPVIRPSVPDVSLLFDEGEPLQSACPPEPVIPLQTDMQPSRPTAAMRRAASMPAAVMHMAASHSSAAVQQLEPHMPYYGQYPQQQQQQQQQRNQQQGQLYQHPPCFQGPPYTGPQSQSSLATQGIETQWLGSAQVQGHSLQCGNLSPLGQINQPQPNLNNVGVMPVRLRTAQYQALPSFQGTQSVCPRPATLPARPVVHQQHMPAPHRVTAAPSQRMAVRPQNGPQPRFSAQPQPGFRNPQGASQRLTSQNIPESYAAAGAEQYNLQNQQHGPAVSNSQQDRNPVWPGARNPLPAPNEQFAQTQRLPFCLPQQNIPQEGPRGSVEAVYSSSSHQPHAANTQLQGNPTMLPPVVPHSVAGMQKPSPHLMTPQPTSHPRDLHQQTTSSSASSSPAQISGSTDSGLQTNDSADSGLLNNSDSSTGTDSHNSTGQSQVPSDVYELLRMQDAQLKSLREQLDQLLSKQNDSPSSVPINHAILDHPLLRQSRTVATQSSGNASPAMARKNTAVNQEADAVSINTSYPQSDRMPGDALQSGSALTEMWPQVPPSVESIGDNFSLSQSAPPSPGRPEDQYIYKQPPEGSVSQPVSPIRPEGSVSGSSGGTHDATLSNDNLTLGELHLTQIQDRTEESIMSQMIVDMPAYTSMSPEKSVGCGSSGYADTDSSPVLGESVSMYENNLSDFDRMNGDTGLGESHEDTSLLFRNQKQFYENLLGGVHKFLGNYSDGLDGEGAPVEQLGSTDHPPVSNSSTGIGNLASEANAEESQAYDAEDLTRKQLQKMGINLEECLKGLQEKSLRSDQSSFFFDSAMLPKVSYVSMVCDSDSDNSTYADSLAMKYLSDEQLSELAKLRLNSPTKSATKHSRDPGLDRLMAHAGGGKSDVTLYGLPVNHMSFASRKYLERYGLLEGSGSSAAEVAKQDVAVGLGRNRTSDRASGSRHNDSTGVLNVQELLQRLAERSLIEAGHIATDQTTPKKSPHQSGRKQDLCVAASEQQNGHSSAHSSHRSSLAESWHGAAAANLAYHSDGDSFAVTGKQPTSTPAQNGAGNDASSDITPNRTPQHSPVRRFRHRQVIPVSGHAAGSSPAPALLQKTETIGDATPTRPLQTTHRGQPSKMRQMPLPMENGDGVDQNKYAPYLRMADTQTKHPPKSQQAKQQDRVLDIPRLKELPKLL